MGIVSAALLLPIVFTFFYSFFPKSEMDAYLSLKGHYEESWLPVLVSPKVFSLRQYYTIFIEEPIYRSCSSTRCFTGWAFCWGR